MNGSRSEPDADEDRDEDVDEGGEDAEGRRLTEQEVVELVRAEIRKQLDALSDYKRPRRIEVRFEEFEKTSTQKVKRYLYAIDTARD